MDKSEMFQLHICELKLINGIRLTVYTVLNKKEQDEFVERFKNNKTSTEIYFISSYKFNSKHEFRVCKSDIKSLKYICPIDCWITKKRLNKIENSRGSKELILTENGYEII